jgi:small multidrug resistance pump
MPTGILLAIAIVCEVSATVALRLADGFSRPLPSVVVVVGYGVSFWLLALVLRQLPVGLTYAVWSAVGTALVAGVGMVAFGEPATAAKLASLALIIMGVVGLNVAGTH